MTRCDVLIVGGGPAGLRAAELVSAAGLRTVLADHKPSVGRKFLVASRGGLNLTHSEPVESFATRYNDSRWVGLLADFSPGDLRAWAKELGVDTFIGTSGRVFPESKQAAPLLRRWIERLRKQGVSFRPRHELTSFRKIADSEGTSAAGDSGGYLGGYLVNFSTPEGDSIFQARAVIFALGGASWPQTGSDGGWVKLFFDAGVSVSPLRPFNCGYEVSWSSEFLAEAEGLPLKNIVVRANDISVSGELLITKHGIEGGAIYQLGSVLSAMAEPRIEVDLKPTFTAGQLEDKLKVQMAQGDTLRQAGSPLAVAAHAWRLSRAAYALLKMKVSFDNPKEIAQATKNFSLVLRGPRPIEEAISSAGGVRWSELDDQLMLKRHPGLFCAGEMIDWDAPTGGYLLQGCFSTATRAARGVQKFLTELRN